MVEPTAFYKRSIFLLSWVGLWPYNNTKFRWLYNNIICFISLSIIIPQLFAFKTAEFTLYDLSNRLLPILLCSYVVFKYSVFWYRINVVTELMEQMKYDWKMNQGEPLKILKKYAAIGKRYSVMLIALMYLGVLIPITCHMFSYILCIIVSTNITCQHKFPMAMEYFVDEKKYSFFITLHQYFLLFLDATILAGIETLMITWFQHSCSLFGVVSYHIKKAVFEDCVQSHVSRKYLNRNSKRNIENVINAHRRAMKYAYNLRDKYMPFYGIFLLFVTLSLSINLFLLVQSAFLYRNIEETIIHLVYFSCMLICMVLFNYMIQLTSDAADNIVTIIYNTNWYEASVPLQKLLLIIMMRSIDSFTCSFFGFYNASMEGVSTILKKSVSYFMVMMSMK